MLKRLQCSILFLIGIFLCGNTGHAKTSLHDFERIVQGNIIKTAAPDSRSWTWKTGFGIGGQIRYWWRDYIFGTELECFRHGVDWSNHGDYLEYTYEHRNNVTIIEISPYAGSDILPNNPINLIFSFGAGLYWSDINSTHQILNAFTKRGAAAYEWQPGLNFGLTFEIPKNKKLSFAAGAKYHIMFTREIKIRFLTMFGGVVF